MPSRPKSLGGYRLYITSSRLEDRTSIFAHGSTLPCTKQLNASERGNTMIKIVLLFIILNARGNALATIEGWSSMEACETEAKKWLSPDATFGSTCIEVK